MFVNTVGDVCRHIPFIVQFPTCLVQVYTYDRYR